MYKTMANYDGVIVWFPSAWNDRLTGKQKVTSINNVVQVSRNQVSHLSDQVTSLRARFGGFLGDFSTRATSWELRIPLVSFLDANRAWFRYRRWGFIIGIVSWIPRRAGSIGLFSDRCSIRRCSSWCMGTVGGRTAGLCFDSNTKSMIKDQLCDHSLGSDHHSRLWTVLARFVPGRQINTLTAVKMYHWTAIEPRIGPRKSHIIQTNGRTVEPSPLFSR